MRVFGTCVNMPNVYSMKGRAWPAWRYRVAVAGPGDERQRVTVRHALQRQPRAVVYAIPAGVVGDTGAGYGVECQGANGGQEGSMLGSG